MSNLADGTHYFAKDFLAPSGTPPLYRIVVENGLITVEELHAVHKGGWISTTQVTKMLMGLSDDEWVRVTPELAEQIIAKDEAWWAAKQAGSGRRGSKGG